MTDLSSRPLPHKTWREFRYLPRMPIASKGFFQNFINVRHRSGVKLKLEKVKVDYRHNPLKLFPDPEIVFTCEFDSQVDNVSATHSVDDGTVVSEGTSSAGAFEFTLQMVVPSDDGSGTFVAAPETDVVTVGERVHFQISNDNPLEGVHFFINECTVSDGVSSHSVIANNCGGNGVDSMIEGRIANPQKAGHLTVVF